MLIFPWKYWPMINQRRVLNFYCSLLQIILQARCPASTDDSFSLDDVHIIRNMSCDDLIPTTTPYPTTTMTSAPASAMDCTFEEGKSAKFTRILAEIASFVNSMLQKEIPFKFLWLLALELTNHGHDNENVRHKITFKSFFHN